LDFIKKDVNRPIVSNCSPAKAKKELPKMVSERFLEIARSELREEDARKEQALEHFREWIKKHPFITNVRQGNETCNRYSKKLISNVLLPV